ncbi:hypothetical protein DEU52_1187 [Ensifer adhaerens]|nr:hypothetical protein DEU52_1187 [Ensifer adhaerens]
MKARSRHNGTKTVSRRGTVPPPPDPFCRTVPLPWQNMKSAIDDPEAHKRVEAIITSESYRLAIEDPKFLDRDDVRGPRLEVDYLKPELLLRQRGIDGTIVVFGSTRICEPEAAKRNLEALRAAVGHREAGSLVSLQVAERLLEKARFYEIARDLAREVGRSNRAHPQQSVVIMTGSGLAHRQLVSISVCHTNNFPILMLVRTSAFACITLEYASCTSSNVQRHLWCFLAVLVRLMSCLRHLP